MINNIKFKDNDLVKPTKFKNQIAKWKIADQNSKIKTMYFSRLKKMTTLNFNMSFCFLIFNI
jgi:hypothetical protein